MMDEEVKGKWHSAGSVFASLACASGIFDLAMQMAYIATVNGMKCESWKVNV